MENQTRIFNQDNAAELAANLKALKAGTNLVSEFFKPELKKVYRFVLYGFTSQEDVKTGEMNAAVKLYDGEKIFTTTSHVIHSALKDYTSSIAVEIEFLRDRKLESGNTLKEFRVVVLD